MNKIQLNNAQVKLVQSWLGPDYHPYAYSNTNRVLWYWKDWYGRPVKGSTKLNDLQLKQLNQLN
jgi:hypothetical protein